MFDTLSKKTILPTDSQLLDYRGDPYSFYGGSFGQALDNTQQNGGYAGNMGWLLDARLGAGLPNANSGTGALEQLIASDPKRFGGALITKSGDAGDNYGGTTSFGNNYGFGLPYGSKDELAAWQKSIGFDGDVWSPDDASMSYGNATDAGSMTPGLRYSDAFNKFLDDNGYTIGTRINGEGDKGFAKENQTTGYAQLFNNSGAPIGDGLRLVDDNNDIVALTALTMAGGFGAATAAGLGGAAGVEAGAAAGGTPAGLSSADLAALYGPEGYGAGLGGVGSAGAVGGGLSSADLAALYGAEGYGSLGTTNALAGAGGAGAAGGGVGAAGGAAGGTSGGSLVGEMSGSLSGGSNGLLGSLGSSLGGGGMDWLGTLGSLGSAYLQAQQGNKALNAQQKATANALALQKYMYDTTRGDWAPYRAVGTNALGKASSLLNNPSSITSDPGYQFGLQQGTNALQNSAAAKGGLYSGQAMKALNQYGQDYAGSKLDQAYNRYTGLAQLGATGVAGTANSGANYANQGSGLYTNQGNAAAANALYQGSLWGNTINNLLGQTTYRNPWGG